MLHYEILCNSRAESRKPTTRPGRHRTAYMRLSEPHFEGDWRIVIELKTYITRSVAGRFTRLARILDYEGHAKPLGRTKPWLHERGSERVGTPVSRSFRLTVCRDRGPHSFGWCFLTDMEPTKRSTGSCNSFAPATSYACPIARPRGFDGFPAAARTRPERGLVDFRA